MTLYELNARSGAGSFLSGIDRANFPYSRVFYLLNINLKRINC